MNDALYEMIFKRKSFHLFRNVGYLGEQLDLCLKHKGIAYTCRYFTDAGTDEERTIAAAYTLLRLT